MSGFACRPFYDWDIVGHLQGSKRPPPGKLQEKSLKRGCRGLSTRGQHARKKKVENERRTRKNKREQPRSRTCKRGRQKGVSLSCSDCSETNRNKLEENGANRNKSGRPPSADSFSQGRVNWAPTDLCLPRCVFRD